MGQKLIARGLNNAKMKLAIDLGNGIGIITCAQHVKLRASSVASSADDACCAAISAAVASNTIRIS